MYCGDFGWLLARLWHFIQDNCIDFWHLCKPETYWWPRWYYYVTSLHCSLELAVVTAINTNMCTATDVNYWWFDKDWLSTMAWWIWSYFWFLWMKSWAGIIILLLCEIKHHTHLDTTGRLPFITVSKGIMLPGLACMC